MRFLPLFFVLLPVLEMVVLIKVGGMIGALNTVALVILGGILGLGIIRQQGFSTMLNVRTTMAQGELPAQDIIEGGVMAMAGFLIMLPGFITDFLGLALLVPASRLFIIRKILGSGHWQVRQTEVYDGEFYRETRRDQGHARVNHTYEGELVNDAQRDDSVKK
ncbi:FxsA family protein [Endozoicomonas sp. Mp262]|uniref:FxsA family protein n=1 Tax=Endozoicomonas sp. Mp262 TaxID=2919499 RepID=UPI0021D7D5E9